jgi:hypothetical protein
VNVKDILNKELGPGNFVAFATTTRPGRSSHAVLKVGWIRYIGTGKGGEYALVDVEAGDGQSPTCVKESQKIVKLEDQ